MECGGSFGRGSFNETFLLRPRNTCLNLWIRNFVNLESSTYMYAEAGEALLTKSLALLEPITIAAVNKFC